MTRLEELREKYKEPLELDPEPWMFSPHSGHGRFPWVSTSESYVNNMVLTWLPTLGYEQNQNAYPNRGFGYDIGYDRGR